MKKLLVIIILGLLLSSNAYAKVVLQCAATAMYEHWDPNKSPKKVELQPSRHSIIIKKLKGNDVNALTPESAEFSGNYCRSPGWLGYHDDTTYYFLCPWDTESEWVDGELQLEHVWREHWSEWSGNANLLTIDKFTGLYSITYFYPSVIGKLLKSKKNIFDTTQMDRLNNWGHKTTGECRIAQGQHIALGSGTDGERGGTEIRASGSGFFINKKGYFVTNYHVVAECNDKSKITFKEEEIDAKLIAKDKSLDLALLRAKVKPKDYLKISTARPEKLQKIIVAGYPFGKGVSDDLKFTQGIISSLKGYDDNSNEIQIDAAINPGNSGGPIVNEDGELVAVAVSGLAKDQSEGINFGIKASSVKNFLDVNSAKFSDAGTISFGFSNKKLNQLLENSTVFTYCN